MKRKIGLLCVLLLVCLVQGDISNSRDQEIQKVKLSAERVVNDLLNFKTIINNDTVKGLQNGSDEFIETTNSIFSYYFTEIHNAVNAMKAQGNDADMCLVNAKNSFQDITDDRENKIRLYLINATSDVNPILDSVGFEIKQGENITYELDKTNVLCFSLNSTEYTACVDMKLEACRTMIDDLKKRHELRQLQEQTLFSDALKRFQSFFKEYEKNIESMIDNIMLSASKCVKNVEYFSKTVSTTTIKPIDKKEVLGIEEDEWMDLLGF